MEPINIAAIDIGSNGARLLIKRFDEDNNGERRMRKLMFIRVPLRLGKDVFTQGKISKERCRMMMCMMKGYQQFMQLHNVDIYRACATSAMRDAVNGKKVIKKIEQETGIAIEILPGAEEARLLFNNILENTECDNGNFAYVDVGGGSTEISLLHDGRLAECRSFNVGTLRFPTGEAGFEAKNEMRNILEEYSREFPYTRIIGSGGNINKLFKLACGKSEDNILRVGQLYDIYSHLSHLSFEERMEKYKLKEDRADVIIPASEIFLLVADALKCDEIMVPNISLADSIVNGLYREHCL